MKQMNTEAKPFAIFDWAMNELTKHGTFESFDDGWEYILENWPNEEDHEDLFVLNYEEGETV